jgi:hypothetical protein
MAQARKEVLGVGKKEDSVGTERVPTIKAKVHGARIDKSL